MVYIQTNQQLQIEKISSIFNAPHNEEQIYNALTFHADTKAYRIFLRFARAHYLATHTSAWSIFVHLTAMKPQVSMCE